MAGEPIQQVNEGLKALAQDLKGDEQAADKVQILIVSVGGSVTVDTEWTDAGLFDPPRLSASGQTPLGQGVRLALEAIEARKAAYRTAGINYRRPWLFIISDGEPTDHGWEMAADSCREAETSRKTSVFVVGVSGANRTKLQRFSNREVMQLKGLQFKELFLWLSASARAASRAPDADAPVQLPKIDWSVA
ncbi:uncharacterized protein YegL [Azospirillum soli]|nr:uncharacterized protein YegL [Azospirillum soli]